VIATDRKGGNSILVAKALTTTNMTYDMCVLTGDYRGATFGPFDAAMEGLARVRAHLKAPVYGVLGNHDAWKDLIQAPHRPFASIHV
jgi:predicted MPP superfamily phosphohydrolase